MKNKLNNNQIKILMEKRAKAKGFFNLSDAISSKPKYALYVVIKKLNISDLCEGIRVAIKKKEDVAKIWHNQSWGKTVVLFGNPQALDKIINFSYTSKNIGILGPTIRSSTQAKKLLNLVHPLRSSPIKLESISHKDKGVNVVFHQNSLSLGKLIAQIVHFIGDLVFDLNIKSKSISINSPTGKQEPILERIDGGVTEVQPFTHIATVYQ
ncbi:hypothetical protein ACFL1M_01575 [Patescibacteria group bacterium]